MKLRITLRYSFLILQVLSFVIELFLTGIEDRGHVLLYQYIAYLILFIIVFLKFKVFIDKNIKVISVFIGYLFILGLFSSDYFVTYNYLIKFSIGLLHFIIGYTLFVEIDIKRDYYIYLLIMLSVGLVISYYNYYTKSGISIYGGDFYSLAKSNSYNMFSFLIITLYLIIKMVKKRSQYFLFLALILITLFLLLLVFKRTPFFILFSTGLFILILETKLKKLLKTIIVTSSFILILYLLAPFYVDIFNKNFDLRKSKFESSLTDEGRFIENIAVINIITESPISFFCGSSEVFNSRGKYGIYEDRMLHNDYANIIWSSGILGAYLYFGWFIRLFLFFYKSYKIKKTTSSKSYSLIGISVIIAYFTCAIGQAWTSISIMSLIMLNLGIFYRKVQILNLKKKHHLSYNSLSRN